MPESQKILLQQVIIPHYRMGFFLLLREHWGECFQTVAGEEDFGFTPRTPPDAWQHFRRVRNHYLFGRKFLWQRECLGNMIAADVLIANANMRTLSTWAALIARKLLRRKTILWGHAKGQSHFAVRLRGFYLCLCDGFIAYTHTQREDLRKIYCWLNIWVAPNACTFTKDCQPVQARTEEVDSFLYVGRLIALKKVALFLEGFIETLRRQKIPPTTRLVYVGNGPEMNKLKARVQEAELEEQVVFTGHRSDIESLRNIYRRAICTVSPGYVGLSATQSFSFGVPMLIAGDEFHSPEIESCREGFNAEFFRSDDVDDLAQHLIRFYRNRKFWLRRRGEIAEWTKQNYSFEAMRDTFVQAVNQV